MRSILADQVDKERLKALEDKIEAAKKAAAGETETTGGVSAGEVGWRMVTELVAGIFIGFGIGYGLDAVFGTQPFLMVLFTLLGFAAGVNVMMRTAKEFQTKQLANQAGENERDRHGDGS
jgi:ATP synthase protein I